MKRKLPAPISTHMSARDLRVTSSLKQFDDDGLVGQQLQGVERRRPQAVHSCAGHKHSGLGQTRGPGRIQSLNLRPQVEQDEEVDAAPGSQEGPGWGEMKDEATVELEEDEELVEVLKGRKVKLPYRRASSLALELLRGK